ncbi:MAG: GntR family transcriptional regulator [Proteobacteria bacterium]|nr:GntR family transcriptional regulator [Pseudomonadota bacterium]
MSIVVRTLSEQVFEVVRERIVAGRLPTDQPVRQDALAAELGVSKIPLREALARLEQEGLLTSQANRGYFVQPMSAADVDEIYDLRLRIEPQATAAAAQAAAEEDRSRARQAFERLDRAATGQLAEVARRNREFHAALVRPGTRALTAQLVERLLILSERYVIAHLKPAGRGSRAHREHRELLEAWLARDRSAIEQLVAQHLQGTRGDLRGQLAAADA